MPTLRRGDCVSAGSGGKSGEIECEGELEPELAMVLALRWKNEWIWYWRLRSCSAEAVGNAMMSLPWRQYFRRSRWVVLLATAFKILRSETNTARLR
jgi:hypothetical protein